MRTGYRIQMDCGEAAREIVKIVVAAQGKHSKNKIGRGWEIFLPRATLRGPGPSIGLCCLRHEPWCWQEACFIAYLSWSSILGLGEG